jgi:hypothetical protein
MTSIAVSSRKDLAELRSFLSALPAEQHSPLPSVTDEQYRQLRLDLRRAREAPSGDSTGDQGP